MDSIDALKWGRGLLSAAGTDSFSLDALVLLSYVLDKPKEWLFAHDYSLTEAEEKGYRAAIEKRAGGVPVSYIVRSREFMGLSFYVDENVLIPRGDTEILVETLIEEAKRINHPKILDMCTGSGCIAISAAYYIEGAEITGVDISGEAIAIAETNARAIGVSGRCAFYRGDLFQIFEKTVQISELFDIIVSNPPYISDAEMEQLPGDVRREPAIALCGGVSGLSFYERIARGARTLIKKGGHLLLEIGCTQAAEVIEILNKNGYNNINIYRDLAGYDRVIKGEYGCSTD